MKYIQKVIPEAKTPEEWNNLPASKLRLKLFDYLRKNYSGYTFINKDLNIPITVSVKSCRKTAYGEAMYIKKAASVLILKEIVQNAKYNNFGERKDNDSPSVIGYLNFKCKCVIDGQKECVRLSIQFQKGGKFYYNIEVNKKVCTT